MKELQAVGPEACVAHQPNARMGLFYDALENEKGNTVISLYSVTCIDWVSLSH